ncbi:hypothetical protein JST99_02235 [Candidatus Dependentiae bacterium]|nr:hypothetical protein [Candidatus Dependentiae bacterium]MCC7415036.1 hypothetical protein [Campylobacterota bacterium]
MLKKRLCMLIILSCLAQPLIYTTEQPTTSTYTKDIDEQNNSAPTESIDDFELEYDFLDSYIQPEPSKSQKLLAKLLALLAPALIALLPYYLYVSGNVHAMKIRAVACCQALMRQKATHAGTIKKG